MATISVKEKGTQDIGFLPTLPLLSFERHNTVV